MAMLSPASNGRGHNPVGAMVLGAVRGAILGVFLGYLAGGLALSALSLHSMLYTFAWALQGGRGETAGGEIFFWVAVGLALPNPWNVGGSLIGAAIGAAIGADLAARQRGKTPQALSLRHVRGAGSPSRVVVAGAIEQRYVPMAKFGCVMVAIAVSGFVWFEAADDLRRSEAEKIDLWQHLPRKRSVNDVMQERLAGFEQACAAEVGASCFQAGLMYEGAPGVTRNFATAAAFYRKACAVHYGIGCVHLGDSYIHGEGVARDEARGRSFYAAAANLLDDTCARGEAYSCYALATMYQIGQGVTLDVERARGLFDQACRGGNKQACVALQSLR